MWCLLQPISKPVCASRQSASLDSHSSPGFIHATIRNSLDSTTGEPGSSTLEQSVKSIVIKVNLIYLFLPGTAATKTCLTTSQGHTPSTSHSGLTLTSFQKLSANSCCFSVLVMQVEGPAAADTWPVYISSLCGHRWGHKGSDCKNWEICLLSQGSKN